MTPVPLSFPPAAWHIRMCPACHKSLAGQRGPWMAVLCGAGGAFAGPGPGCLGPAQSLARRKEAGWFHCCFQHGVNSPAPALEGLSTAALGAACQFKEIWFWMQEPTILFLSEAAADKMLSFLYIWAHRGRSLSFPATALGNVMFPVSPSAWQVHLVWVSLRTPGRAAATSVLPRACPCLCLSPLLTLLLPADPTQNLKLLFLLQGLLKLIKPPGTAEKSFPYNGPECQHTIKCL